MATIIDGKRIAGEVRAEIAKEAEAFEHESGVKPGLAVIIAGDNPASQVYVRNKKKAAAEVGFFSRICELPGDISEEALLALIDELNHDPKIHGILVQLPLPSHLSEQKVLLAIDPAKDVDAFHPYNVGKIMIGNFDLLPCTPAGVMELLSRLNDEGTTIVMVTHSQHDAAYAHRVIHLLDGEIVDNTIL